MPKKEDTIKVELQKEIVTLFEEEHADYEKRVKGSTITWSTEAQGPITPPWRKESPGTPPPPPPRAPQKDPGTGAAVLGSFKGPIPFKAPPPSPPPLQLPPTKKAKHG